MWVSEMSEASVANPDEGAEQCEATEERQLGVSCSTKRAIVKGAPTAGGPARTWKNIEAAIAIAY